MPLGAHQAGWPARAAAVLCALALAVGLGACSDEESDDDAGARPTTTAATTAATTTDRTTTTAGDIDQAAVTAMLRRYAADYNAGRYAEAAARLSNATLARCGDILGAADALQRNHEIEGIDFRVIRVTPWGAQGKADVAMEEKIDGTWEPIELGLGPFLREGGLWVMEGLLPVGAEAFCDG